jgi:hypothetical protein
MIAIELRNPRRPAEFLPDAGGVGDQAGHVAVAPRREVHRDRMAGDPARGLDHLQDAEAVPFPRLYARLPRSSAPSASTWASARSLTWM